MPNRRKMSKRGSGKYFTATAAKHHYKNSINYTNKRGGNRL